MPGPTFHLVFGPLTTVSLLATLLLSGCPADDGEPLASDTASTGDAASTGATDGVDDTGSPDVSGEELFGMLCSPCHGPRGEGTVLGYEIQHPVRSFSTWVVRNGRPGPEFDGSSMTAYAPATVPDATLEEIWDYLDTFPQPTTGEGLYLDYCRNCHGVDAGGGVTGVGLRDQPVSEIFEKVREGEDLGNPGGRDSFMPAFDSSWLTDAEIQRIADHIATL